MSIGISLGTHLRGGGAGSRLPDMPAGYDVRDYTAAVHGITVGAPQVVTVNPLSFGPVTLLNHGVGTMGGGAIRGMTPARRRGFLTDFTFDGINDHIQVGKPLSGNKLRLYDTDFTIAVTVTPDFDKCRGVTARIIDKSNNSSGTNGYALSITPSSGALIFYVDGSVDMATVNGTIEDGQTYEIVLTKTNGGTGTIWINGAEQTLSTNAGRTLDNQYNHITIGNFGTGDTYYFGGVIKDVKLYDYTVASPAGLVVDPFYEVLNGDDDGDAFPVTTAVEFDGSTQSINLGDNYDLLTAALRPGLTAAAWVRTTTTECGIIGKWVDGVSYNYRWELAIVGGVAKVNLDYGVSEPSATGVTVINDGEWHHLAVVFDRYGAFHVYVDGAEETAWTALTNYQAINFNSSMLLTIGARPGDPPGPCTHFLDGEIAKVGVWTTALTGEQISRLAAGWRVSSMASDWRLDDIEHSLPVGLGDKLLLHMDPADETSTLKADTSPAVADGDLVASWTEQVEGWVLEDEAASGPTLRLVQGARMLQFDGTQMFRETGKSPLNILDGEAGHIFVQAINDQQDQGSLFCVGDSGSAQEWISLEQRQASWTGELSAICYDTVVLSNYSTDYYNRQLLPLQASSDGTNYRWKNRRDAFALTNVQSDGNWFADLSPSPDGVSVCCRQDSSGTPSGPLAARVGDVVVCAPLAVTEEEYVTAYLAKKYSRAKRIAIMGDSRSNYPDWPANLLTAMHTALPFVQFRLFSDSGDNTLNQALIFLNSTIGTDFDVLIIWLGVNDVANLLDGASAVKRMSWMADYAVNRGKKVIVFGEIPIQTWNPYGAEPDPAKVRELKVIDDGMAAYAAATSNVTFFDVRAVLCTEDHDKRLDWAYSKSGDLGAGDWMHPNAAGNAAIATALLPYIQSVCGADTPAIPSLNDSYPTGIAMGAAAFNGSSTYGTMADPGHSLTDLTVMCRIRAGTLEGGAMSNYDYILTQYDANDQRSWAMFNYSDQLSVRLSGDGLWVGERKEYRGTTDIDDGNEHLVGFTWSGGVLKLWVDGAEETLTLASPDESFTDNELHNSTAAVTAGCRLDTGSPTDFCNTRISDIRIINRALGADEWADIWTNGFSDGVDRTDYVAWLDFHEGTGTTAADVVGSNDMTLVNSPPWSTIVGDYFVSEEVGDKFLLETNDYLLLEEGTDDVLLLEA